MGARGWLVAAGASALVFTACGKISGLDDLERVACYGGAPCPSGDAGYDAGNDAGPDAGNDADLGVLCGDRRCARAEEEVCCAPSDGGAAGCTTQQCVSGTIVTCLTNADCTDPQICCGVSVGATGGPSTGIACTAPDFCMWPVCDPGAATPCPPDGGTCTPSGAGVPALCK
jgi:hypothetical protein